MFVKSSFCTSNACVAVEFVTSSFCTSTTCVEVSVADQVRVRDMAGNICTFDRDEWSAFIAGCKNSEFDAHV